MNEVLNHECVVCGTKYSHCDDCAKTKLFSSWRTICDTPQHYQIFIIITDYQNKHINKAEARNKLDDIGVTKNIASSFKKSVKNIIYDILDNEIKTVNYQNKKNKK